MRGRKWYVLHYKIYQRGYVRQIYMIQFNAPSAADNSPSLLCI
jgi:hypothetical protein